MSPLDHPLFLLGLTSLNLIYSASLTNFNLIINHKKMNISLFINEEYVNSWTGVSGILNEAPGEEKQVINHCRIQPTLTCMEHTWNILKFKHETS